ncbi:MAG: suppressor of fused domain protein [Clostridia bacterium]|nr:suppressor of fused domain protein [Clostridia bacterium]
MKRGEKMEPYSFDDITDRQLKTLAHTLSTIGGTAEQVHFFKSEQDWVNLFPVDIAIIEPTEIFEYFIVTTVGLSAFKFSDGTARAELIMLLPKDWKVNPSKQEYFWPVKLMKDIALSAVKNKVGVVPLQVYQIQEEEPYETTKFIGGIVNLPELFPVEYIDEKIGVDYTRFYQVVPITKKQLDKINDIGSVKFIRFDLHDAEGPLLNVEVPDVKKNEGKKIDRIISHNERTLKGK